MAIRKNAKASIWEVIVLYALQQSFPGFGFINEFPLSKIKSNSNIDTAHRFYDIYSEKEKVAVEVSRIGAHSSTETQDRDEVKQEFSDENNIKLFHLRDVLCDSVSFSNVIPFKTKVNTKNILFPIQSLSPAIETLITSIEKTYQVKRRRKINYSKSLDEIKEMYERISGKVYDETAIVGMNDEQLAKKLKVDLKSFKEFKNKRKLSSQDAFLFIQNNKTKWNGKFICKNKQEAKLSSAILKEQSDCIKKLKKELKNSCLVKQQEEIEIEFDFQ